eukprot:CAMPEP_0174693814 /NCGR_PEP_ID=MMETSP1094-20130205/457_1 /TAXON_ID=156173 /ORGANISM="Chrysochromulina brevifilum, Strain UTEX LB 985" /LENGTH=183 /DNA_ID=CAMNT_0015889829 /DNA_START=377 /DNA_END=925 /DNA_ORIENTATION=-
MNATRKPRVATEIVYQKAYWLTGLTVTRQTTCSLCNDCYCAVTNNSKASQRVHKFGVRPAGWSSEALTALFAVEYFLRDVVPQLSDILPLPRIISLLDGSWLFSAPGLSAQLEAAGDAARVGGVAQFRAAWSSVDLWDQGTDQHWEQLVANHSQTVHAMLGKAEPARRRGGQVGADPAVSRAM